jgi:hypothetical protein
VVSLGYKFSSFWRWSNARYAGTTIIKSRAYLIEIKSASIRVSAQAIYGLLTDELTTEMELSQGLQVGWRRAPIA